MRGCNLVDILIEAFLRELFIRRTNFFAMKRKIRTPVSFLISSLLLSMVLCVDAQRGCMQVTYLEVGKEGMISCSLTPFYAVSWYTKEDYDDEEIPLLHFNGNKHGQVDEYDVHPNGSLIFRNVSFNHPGNYIVTMLQDVTSDLFVTEVYVGVYVTPYPLYPVVEGHITQQHVYMDANRNGQLSCSMRHVYPIVSLSWTVVDPSQSKMILFQDDVVGREQNEDKTFDILLTSLYEVTDQSVRRITIQCGVADDIGEVLSSRTKVDLLFSSVYPVVNGHFNQKHVYLDVDRRGHLTCVKENVDAGTSLVWKIVNSNLREKITLQSTGIVLDNNDGTVTINQTCDYEIHDHLLDRITIKCEVITLDANDIPLATKVDLLLQNVYPVVNGHINQNHVYLDVDRMGHLSCVKENVDAGTRLVWVLDSPLSGKVTFQSSAITVINPDNTVNINQTFDYVVHDNFLERITIECKVIEPHTVEHPIATKVELLLSSALPPPPDPVISGCYHQPQECVLEVERSGELTCTVKNSHFPVDLKWTTLDGDKAYLVFEKTRVKSHNSTDLYDVSITTPYTVIDKSVTSVTVQCDACRSDSGQVLATAKTSLRMTDGELTNTDGDTDNSTCGFVWTVVLATVFSVIVHGLLVFILWYKNRKMHKNYAVKFLKPLVDRRTHFEHCLPEVTNGTTPHFTARGKPVRCSSDEEVQDVNESLESPDSGNSGSNSRELSGSEASEKSHLIDDIEMPCSNSKQDPLHVSKEGFEDVSIV